MVTWITRPTYGAGLVVGTTVNPLLVYITVFGAYAEYNTRGKQCATGLVGHRLLEWVAHHASAFCLVLHTQANFHP